VVLVGLGVEPHRWREPQSSSASRYAPQPRRDLGKGDDQEQTEKLHQPTRPKRAETILTAEPNNGGRVL
jgi:hypothetical protein